MVNSELYYERMNSAKSDKSIILDYIKGNRILDVGPGGGIILDLISSNDNDYELYGIDNSDQVIEKLSNKYNVIKGNALYINNYFSNLDTIIFSSVMHEIYSYNNFNHETVKQALINAYNALNNNGRIIIRDGIMDSSEKRIIEFKNIDDINFLKKYCNDFKGRKITYKVLDEKRVLMDSNDAMEFLYTFTWGEKSYEREVQEQFGIYTLKEYLEVIKSILPYVKIIEAREFLQSGYEEHLLDKINYYDEQGNIVKLPNSTSLIVLEKRQKI